MKSAITSLIAVLGLSAALALADVYRSTMPDGTVIYADLPQPGAKDVRRVRPGPASTGTIIVTPQDEIRARTAGSPPLPSPGVSVVPRAPSEPAPELLQGRRTLDRKLPKSAH